MMFEHLGEAASAARLNAAIERVARVANVLTPDLGGGATTEAVADAVIDALSRGN